MHLLESKFRHAMAEIQQPPASYYQGDKQVFYLTFQPTQTLAVKRHIPSLVGIAEHEGWHVHQLSIGRIVADFFNSDPTREFILEEEHSYQPNKAHKLFADMGSGLREQKVIENAVLQAQAFLSEQRQTILLLTDLEFLHPYARFGPIEQHIYNELNTPIIVLYPGRLTGSSLEFLNIYPPDGGYRSTHT